MADAKQINIGVIDGNYGYAVINVGSFLMDQTTDQTEWIVQASAAVTITRLGFSYGLRTGTPPTFKISLQGVDLTTGVPDGTIKGGGTPASATFTPPADTSWNATWQWITLDNAFTVARGDYFAIVIAYSAGTVDASNNSTFGTISNNAGAVKFPYAIHNNAGTRTKQSASPVYGYGSSTVAYGVPIQTGYNGPAYNSGSTPDEYALRFKLDAGWSNTFQIGGVRVVFTSVASTTYKAVLYGSATADPTNLTSTNVLQDVTVDSDLVRATAGSDYRIYFDETTLATLYYGNTYRLAIQPQGAVNVTMFGFTAKTTTELDAFPGGAEFYLSTRTDLGAWTDTPLTRPLVDLLLFDITKPAAAGLLVHPGLVGGMRG